MGGIEQLAETVATDLEQRLPGQRKTQRGKLALLVATMLQGRRANLMDVAACLPRPAGQPLPVDQAISGQHARGQRRRDGALWTGGAGAAVGAGSDRRSPDRPDTGERAPSGRDGSGAPGRPALPLAWRVKETQGAIGFAEQRTALEAVARLLPTGIRPVLIGDRFYGSPDLIGWCCEQGWDWRLRLK